MDRRSPRPEAYAPRTADRLGHAHITLCIAPDCTVEFYPKGDPNLLAIGLAKVVESLSEHPERILCATGACKDRHEH